MGYCKLLGGGTNIGRYVWRKSIITQPEVMATNPSIHWSTIYQNYAYYTTITCSVANFTGFTNEELATFLDKFQRELRVFQSLEPYFTHTAGDMYLKFAYDSYHTYNWIVSNIRNVTENSFQIYSTDGSQNSGTLYYYGQKKVQKLIATPSCFVVGNNIDQYPTNGQKGDYWYELIGQVASTNALSLTDDATNLIKNIAVEEIKREVILNVD